MNESKSIVAIALCVVFYLGYEYYLKNKYADYYEQQRKTAEAPKTPEGTPPPAAAPGATTTPGASPVPPTSPALADIKRLSPEDLTVETDTNVYRFSQDAGGLQNVILKAYLKDKKTSEPVDLLDAPFPLHGTIDPGLRAPVPGAFTAERDGRKVRFIRQLGDIKVTQEYEVPEKGYALAVRMSFTNTGAAAVDLNAGFAAFPTLRHKKTSSLMGFIPGVVTEKDHILYRADGSTETADLEATCKDSDRVGLGSQPIAFFGIDRHYFLATLSPKAKSQSLRIEPTSNNADVCSLVMTSTDKQGFVEPGQTVLVEADGYFGPKDPDIMHASVPSLDNAVNTGIFGFLAKPLLAVIEGFHKATGNYGVAIILLTILLKVLFYPLMRASSVSMHKMKKLNPQMQALRDKFKDDRQRQQQELMKFMSANKMNPMQGCLPVLPQIPVFFAFYQVLQTSIQLRHAPFFFWIQDLSAMDPYIVTPLLMGVAMVVQQKLTPTTGMDKTQEKILMFMPVMFTVMMLTLPAGLTLYMLTNTVVGIAQQKWLYMKLDKSPA